MKKIILLLTMFILMSSFALATTVTRSFSDSTIDKNTEITVTLTVDATSDDTYYLIDEEYPSGMTLSSVSGNGDSASSAGHIYWTVLQDATDVTYTYKLNSGNLEGDFDLIGTYGSETKQETPILGENTITVGAGGNTTTDNNYTVWIIVGIAIVGLLWWFNK